MEVFFLKLLQMSLSAAVVILVVLAVRQLLRRAPKKWSYLLWSVVGFRLAVPVSLSSVFSIFRLTAIRPGAGEAVSVYVPRAVVLAPRVLLPASGTGVTAPALAPAAESAAELSLQLWPLLGIILWGIGAAALLIWGAVSYVCLHRQLIGAVRIRDGVWETDRIRVPFLLGLFRPQIYVPLHLDGETMDYVLAHESCHIRRGDHWVKCLAFLLLALHWFNPLVWVAFCLMGRDMEMSCDERVLSQRENSAKPYSLSLLSFAAVRRFPSPAPLAFGETGVRQRVRNALQWKKPRLWVTLLAAVLCIAVLAACGTDPAKEQAGDGDAAGAAVEMEPTGEDRAEMTPPESWPEGQTLAEADMIGDDAPEEIVFYDLGGGTYAFRVLSGANQEFSLFSDLVSETHAGWRSWYLCDRDGGTQLLCYTPAFGTGVCEYSYELYEMGRNGCRRVKYGFLSFSLTPGQVELPAEEMTAFAEELNELLDSSTLLVSTVGGTLTLGPAAPVPENYDFLSEYEAVIPFALPKTDNMKDRLRTLEAALRTFWTEDTAAAGGLSAYLELDPESLQAFLKAQGLTEEALLQGMVIDAAAPEETGTSIQTIYGDTVLALDTARGITLVRIDAKASEYYRGILAIIQDPAAVTLAMASGEDRMGQTLADIAHDQRAILAIGASCYQSNGADYEPSVPYGLAVSGGEQYSSPVYNTAMEAVWLDHDNILHVDPWKETDEVRDGVQFYPALIKNGRATRASAYAGWGKQRRTAIAQRGDGAIIMAVMDYNGIELDDLTELLLRYGAVEACNLDGGSSSMMYYNGRIVTRGSSAEWAYPRIPDAFVVYAGLAE